MTRGEKWKKFLADKGWLVNDVISGGENETLKISICESGFAEGRKPTVVDSALVMKDYDILCYESPSGTVFFQWDDIMQIKLEIDKKKRGWL